MKKCFGFLQHLPKELSKEPGLGAPKGPEFDFAVSFHQFVQGAEISQSMPFSWLRGCGWGLPALVLLVWWAARARLVPDFECQ